MNTKRWITDWFSERLNLKSLRQNCLTSNPYGEDFNYVEEFQQIDYFQLKKDLEKLMTTWSFLLSFLFLPSIFSIIRKRYIRGG